jgi:hypothetical protein
MKTEVKVHKCKDLLPIGLDNINLILKYTKLREIESCEYSLTTLFMWKKMYNPHIYVEDDFLIIFEHYEGKCYSLMPLCTEEYFLESFLKTVEIFEEMNEEFVMYCADESYANVINETESEWYHIEAERYIADYIYDGESLRTLKGKKLRKKRNHINAFVREHEGEYEMMMLTKDHKVEIMAFLKHWCLEHGNMTNHLEEEIDGICYILDHLKELGSTVVGVYIKDKLEAVSIGSLINNNREVIIHVEKANIEIRGLYPYINQMFLNEVYPNVEIVNREDDLGVEGLRRAKLSYEPLRLENKYTISPLVSK